MDWYPDRSDKYVLCTVKTKRVTLPEGDYTITGHERDVLVERKGSLDELCKNLLTEDYARALDAFERLAGASDHPYLLLECTPAQLQRKTPWCEKPERVLSAMAHLVQRLGLHLLLVGQCKTPHQKRVVGKMVLHLMMAHVYGKETDYAGTDEVIRRLTQTGPGGALEGKMPGV